MVTERRAQSKGFAAICERALELLAVCFVVRSEMSLEIAVLSEFLPTFEAEKLADASMSRFVVFQMMMLHETFFASEKCATIALYSFMCSHVIVEPLLSFEFLLADLTFILDFSVNRFLMFSQVQDALESLVAFGARDGILWVVGVKMRVSV